MKYIALLSVVFFSPFLKADILVKDLAEIQKYVDEGKHEEIFRLIDTSRVRPIRISAEGELEIEISKDNIATLGVYSQLGEAITNGQLKEVSCLDSSFNTSCSLKVNFLIQEYRLIWKKHNDPKKVRRFLKLNRTPSEGLQEPFMPISQSFSWFFENQFDQFHPLKPKSDLVDQLSSPKIKCDSYRWASELSQIFGVPNKSLNVSEWTTELMFINPETQIAENMTLKSAFDVEMNLNFTEGLSFSKIGFIPGGSPFFGGSLFVGDILGWGLTNGKHYCDLSFAFDLASIQNAFEKASEKMEPEKMKFVEKMDKKVLDSIIGDRFGNSNDLLPLVTEGDFILLNAQLQLLNPYPVHSEIEYEKKNSSGEAEKVMVSVFTYETREVFQ